MPFENGFGNDRWPLAWWKARLLQCNWLDPIFGARIATLPNRPNPSSAYPLLPFSRTLLGRQAGFGRHFTFNPGTLATEWGLNNQMLVKLAGDATWYVADFGAAEFSSGPNTARYLQGLLNDHADLGTVASSAVWTVTYDDETQSDDPTFCFTISCTTDFALARYSIANGKDHDNAGLETLGFLEAETGTEQASHTGHRTVGTEEWIAWDVGEAVLLGRESGSLVGGGAPTADWFALRDCNFDRVAAAAAQGQVESSGWDVSRGRAKLVLFASNDLDDLEQWTTATWTEGLNKFTLVDDSQTDPTTDPLRVACIDQRLYGTDGRLWVQRQRDSSWDASLDRATELGGIFPARHITANLRDWAIASDQDGPPFVGPYPTGLGRPGYRYWMLLLVNPGNLGGRQMLGPHALASGFYFGRNLVDGSGRSMLDRGTISDSELGVMVGRPGVPGRELKANFEFVDEGDVDLLEQTTLRLKENDVRTAARHGVVGSSHRLGKHRPFFVIDPLYNPGNEEDDYVTVDASLRLVAESDIFGNNDVAVGGLELRSPATVEATLWADYFVVPVVVFPFGFFLENGRFVYRFNTSTAGEVSLHVTDTDSAWPLFGFARDRTFADAEPDFGTVYRYTADWPPTWLGQLALRSTRWARGTMLASPEFGAAEHQFLELYHQGMVLREWAEEK